MYCVIRLRCAYTKDSCPSWSQDVIHTHRLPSPLPSTPLTPSSAHRPSSQWVQAAVVRVTVATVTIAISSLSLEMKGVLLFPSLPSLLLPSLPKHRGALVEVCAFVTRMTVACSHKCFRCFLRQVLLLKIFGKLKRDCGRTGHCKFVRFGTARPLMNRWRHW